MPNHFIQTLSSILSTLTILSCLFLKVPQIMQIQKTKSTKGMYIQAMLMEIFSFTIVTLYNYTSEYSVMTYLEYPIILVQIYVLLFYFLLYKGMLQAYETIAGTTLYIFLVIAFTTGVLPKKILAYILPFCTPISGFAKVTYIVGMIRQRNADCVSLATWVISISTNLARLFTIFVDSRDITLMMNFIISSTLSAGVLVTAMYYKNQSLQADVNQGILDEVFNKNDKPRSQRHRYENKDDNGIKRRSRRQRHRDLLDTDDSYFSLAGFSPVNLGPNESDL